MIQCTKCKEVKQAEEFYVNKGKANGRASQCKVCAKQYSYTDKAKARHKAWKQSKVDGYYVYYLPEENYVGLTNFLEMRMPYHKKQGKNIDNWKVLWHGPDRKEAGYMEATFQTTLLMEGLNIKS